MPLKLVSGVHNSAQSETGNPGTEPREAEHGSFSNPLPGPGRGFGALSGTGKDVRMESRGNRSGLCSARREPSFGGF